MKNRGDRCEAKNLILAENSANFDFSKAIFYRNRAKPPRISLEITTDIFFFFFRVLKRTRIIISANLSNGEFQKRFISSSSVRTH